MLLLTHLDRSRFTPMLILQRSEGEYLAMLDDDVEVVTLRSPRPPGCVVELFRILRSRRVDVIYTATNAANIYATMAAALPGSRVRAIIGEHTPLAINLAEAKRPVLRRAAMRWSYQRAALAVAPLEEIGNELRDLLGASCPPFRCLPNPVVTALAPPRPLPRHARRIVSVGRLATVKRFDLLIEAFAAFHRNAPDASLVILGDGPERAALETLALELGVAGAVSLPGYVEDVAAHLEFGRPLRLQLSPRGLRQRDRRGVGRGRAGGERRLSLRPGDPAAGRVGGSARAGARPRGARRRDRGSGRGPLICGAVTRRLDARWLRPSRWRGRLEPTPRLSSGC